MAVSVLGKRQRSAIEPQGNSHLVLDVGTFHVKSLSNFSLKELPVRVASSKKQARSVQVRQDDSEAPLSPTRRLRSRARYTSDAQRENDTDNICFRTDTQTEKGTISSKKINSHFRASKPVNGKNRLVISGA